VLEVDERGHPRSVYLSIQRSWISLMGTGLSSAASPARRRVTTSRLLQHLRCFMPEARHLEPDSSSMSVRPSREEPVEEMRRVDRRVLEDVGVVTARHT